MASQVLWSAEQIAMLQSNNGVLSVRELAILLNRSVHSVERAMVRYGGVARRVKRKGIRNVWTVEQIADLRRLLLSESPHIVAKRLGMSMPAVLTKIRMLGLSYIKAKRPWSRSDVLELMALSEKYGRREIAKRTKRNIGSVNNKMKALGLHAFQGSHSMRGAEKQTGYHHLQLMRARDALRQNWRKLDWRNRGRFVISDDQLTEMCEWLKQEQWKQSKAA